MRLVLLLVAACGSAQLTGLAIPAGAPPVLPRLVVDASTHVQLDVRINDLLVTKYELTALSSDTPMPAMYYLPGKNVAAIHYTADPSVYVEKPPSLIVKLSEIDEANPPPYGLPNDKRVFAQFPVAFDACSKGRDGAACDVTQSFQIDGALPAWEWTRGESITDTAEVRKQLLAETIKLREQMAKKDSSLRGKLLAVLADQLTSARYAGKRTIEDVDDLIGLAMNRNASVDELKNLDSLALDVFGGGKLARLRADTIPLIWIVGGAHDAPAGTLGPFSIAFDLWWRKHDGHWVLAAIWRVHPMVKLPK